MKLVSCKKRVLTLYGALVFSIIGSGAIAQEEMGKFKGTWSIRKTIHGIAAKGSGRMSFTVNPAAGTFTCTMNGTGTANGVINKNGAKAKISGSNKVRATSCSGRYNMGTGNLSGSMTVTERGQIKAVISIPDGKGGTTEQTENQPSNDSYTAKISGNIKNGGGNGKYVDDDGHVFKWKVTGSFSGPVTGGNPPEDNKKASDQPEPPAMPPNRPDNEQASEEDAEKKIETTDKPEAEAERENQLAQKTDDKAQRQDLVNKPEEKIEDTKIEEKAVSKEKEKLAKTVVENALKNKKKRPTKADVKKTKLSSLLNDVADKEARRAITQEFLKYKKESMDKDIDSLETELRNIKKQQIEKKKLADAVTKVEELIENKKMKEAAKASDGILKKSWDWLTGNSKSEAVKKLNDVGEKVEKSKAVIDDLAAIKKTIDDVNKKVKEGKITEGRGRVLKGGSILGKALKTVTGWLPVFGDTASEVTDKTFEASLKLANKRATRSTLMEKCFDDPMSGACDDLSGY